MTKHYRIKPGYTINPNPDYDREHCITDNYQDEVYKTGLDLLRMSNLQSVLDLGTGRAYKLLKYFHHVRTLGIDLPPTVQWLKSREGYPTRSWAAWPLPAPKDYELLICADVIEHVVDPDQICEFIKEVNPKFAIISTPDRDLLRHRECDDGPPFNGCHVREWSFQEFRAYMSDHFHVLAHWYPNHGQACQAVTVEIA